jgi:hypothetical protein
MALFILAFVGGVLTIPARVNTNGRTGRTQGLGGRRIQQQRESA